MILIFMKWLFFCLPSRAKELIASAGDVSLSLFLILEYLETVFRKYLVLSNIQVFLNDLGYTSKQG